MNSFDAEDAYRNFAKVVRNERRWVFEGRAANFLEAVRATSKSRGAAVKPGMQLWRCQIGYATRLVATGEDSDEVEVEEEWPHPISRMIPNVKYAKSGQRANPPGIVYLYLATRPETAMAEMRPWLGSWLSVSLFEVQRNLKLVVCHKQAEDIPDRLFDENPSSEKLERHIWNDIGNAFSRPVNRDDLEREYLPTQILAEVFKAAGFDGIAYRSSLAKGTNAVLFDIDAAKPRKNNYLYQFKKVAYTFVADPQFAIRLKKDAGPQELGEITSESP